MLRQKTRLQRQRHYPCHRRGGALDDYPVQGLAGVSRLPGRNNKNVFKDRVGYAIGSNEHKNYTDRQVTTNFSEFANSDILPFTVQTFFATEVGEQQARQLWKQMLEQFGNQEFAELKNALDNGGLTEEQIQALRDEITDKMLEFLGNWQYLLIDIPIVSDIEDAVGDLVLGDEAEELRQYAAELPINESMFENHCEMP